LVLSVDGSAVNASVLEEFVERIESLEERVRQLKAKQQRIELRRRSLSSRRARRDDTRRKILVGAIVLAKVEQEALAESVLRRRAWDFNTWWIALPRRHEWPSC
jgi:uncharacterized protein (UPF0335 family)